MHHMQVSTAALLIAGLGASAVLSSQQVPVVAIEHVSVIPMDRERVLPDQTVLVREGRIAEMGDAAQIGTPAGATRVDGRGRYLIPALAEMHAHIPSGEAAGRAERVLFMYVANGIGTIRSMLGDPGHFALRDRAARGEIVAPTMYLSGPSFSGQSVATPEAASARVVEQKKAGYDLLKIHPGVGRAVFDALAATASRERIRFAGHVPVDVGLTRALDARFWTIDHLDGYIEAMARPGAPAPELFGINLVDHVDESRLPALVAATRAAGTWNVPTQILLENWYGADDVEAMRKWPEMRYADPADVEAWTATKRKLTAAYPAAHRERYIALRRRILEALHDGGARLLLGSDAPQTWNVPGFSIHRELAAYVEAGLSPYDALATGTRHVAEHLGTLDRTGTIASGKRADLVLLEGNPLEQIAHTSRIAGVMIGGRWLPKADIERRLKEGS
jgi:imidazolonepropionase-like amidohydrolase